MGSRGRRGRKQKSAEGLPRRSLVGRLWLLGDRIDPFAVVPGDGYHVQAHLLAERPADEPAHRMRLPLGLLHDLGQGGPAFRWSRAMTSAFLLPSRAVAGLGAVLARLVLWALADAGEDSGEGER